MKYSKVGFRKVYKKFCLFDMNEPYVEYGDHCVYESG